MAAWYHGSSFSYIRQILTTCVKTPYVDCDLCLARKSYGDVPGFFKRHMEMSFLCVLTNLNKGLTKRDKI